MIHKIKEIPIVIADEIDTISKSQNVLRMLYSIGYGLKIKKTKKMRTNSIRNLNYCIIICCDIGIRNSINLIHFEIVNSVNNINFLKISAGGNLSNLIFFSWSSMNSLDKKTNNNKMTRIYRYLSSSKKRLSQFINQLINSD